MSHLYLTEYDASIRWLETGQGDPVLFLPGLSMPVLPDFAAVAADPAMSDRRCILLDYLGSGQSDHPTGFDYALDSHVDTILRVLDHLGIEAVDVLGHSMGGTVGIFLARAAPHRVRRLIVCEGNLEPGGGLMSLRVSSAGQSAFLKAGYAALLQDLRNKVRAGAAGPDRLVAGWQKADPLGLFANARALVELPEDMFEQYANLPMPKFFVFGEQNLGGDATPDTPNPARLTQHDIVPLTVPDAGHAMMLDNPTGFLDVVKTALG